MPYALQGFLCKKLLSELFCKPMGEKSLEEAESLCYKLILLTKEVFEVIFNDYRSNFKTGNKMHKRKIMLVLMECTMFTEC